MQNDACLGNALRRNSRAECYFNWRSFGNRTAENKYTGAVALRS